MQLIQDQQAIWNKRFLSSKTYSYSTKWLERRLPSRIQKESRALDLGCGDGISSTLLAERGYRVIANDLSPVALEKIAFDNERIQVSCFDMSGGLPYENDYFDIVLSNLSSHYFSKDTTKWLYEQIARVLKPGGRFILRVNDKREYKFNKRKDTLSILEPNFVLSKNGKRKRYFTIKDLKYYLNPFFVTSIKRVSFVCNKKIKYALEAEAIKRK